jgi:hypothetical protein
MMTAKKDKKARRLARKRKAQRSTPPSGQQVLLKRVRASQHFHNTQVMVNPAGTEKMSEVILRFAEPFKDHDGLVPRAMIEIATGFSDLCVRLVFMRLSRLPPVKVL